MADGTLKEIVDPVEERWSVAVAEVDEFIAGVEKGERLPVRVMDRYQKRGYPLGWRVAADSSNGVRRNLHILVDEHFPYTPTRIVVEDPPEVLNWPHLEADGFLCLLPPDSAVSSEDPVGVVEYVLNEARNLIKNNATGINVEDFRREFVSYWNLAVDKSAPKFISLLDPQGPSRRVSVWRGQNARVVGESPQILRRWLSRWNAEKRKGQDYPLHDGVMIWLPEPLLPQEYPSMSAEVRALARKQSSESVSVLEEMAASGADEIDVLMGARTLSGACFAAMTLRHPRRAGSADPLTKGFRPGHVPMNVLVDRYLSRGTKVVKACVERADHRWIHGRDHDPRQERLRHARVAILGCGSVGAPLSRLLAQAGVGNLLLVDHETMHWPNVGRHALGAASVNRYKASELASELERAYPHLGEIACRRLRVGPKARRLVDELAAYDLVISVMGNWTGESFLNEFHRKGDRYPPILYGWLEPLAAAAHAVLVTETGACLRCGTNNTGYPNLRVTDWPDGGKRQTPACGAHFTPYGPAELCWAHALLAETAIDALMGEFTADAHRIWIGPSSRIKAMGGTWTKEWVAEMGDPGDGGVTASRPWPKSGSCPACNRRERAK